MTELVKKFSQLYPDLTFAREDNPVYGGVIYICKNEKGEIIDKHHVSAKRLERYSNEQIECAWPNLLREKLNL